MVSISDAPGKSRIPVRLWMAGPAALALVWVGEVIAVVLRSVGVF